MKTSLKTRLGAMAMAAVMAVGMATTAFAAEPTFQDVPEKHWAYDQIEKAYDIGFVNGTSYNEQTGVRAYSPDGTTSLAQLLVMVTRFAYPAEVDASKAEGTWYAKNMEVAKAHGLTEGFADVDVNTAATREQLVTILYRVAGSPAATDEVNIYWGNAALSYTDRGSVASYATEAMKWAVHNGIILGTSETTLSPQGSATRAQMAVILVRYLEKAGKLDGTGSETGTETGSQPTAPEKPSQPSAPAGDLPYKSAEEIIDSTPALEYAYDYCDNFYLTNPDEVVSRTGVNKKYQTIGFTEEPNQNGYRTACKADVSGAVLDYEIVDLINDLRVRNNKPGNASWVIGDSSEEFALCVAKYYQEGDEPPLAMTTTADSLEEAVNKLYETGYLVMFICKDPYIGAAHYTNEDGTTTYAIVGNDERLPFAAPKSVDKGYGLTALGYELPAME